MLLGERAGSLHVDDAPRIVPRSRLARFAPWLLLAVMAGIATAAYGQGTIVGEGQADLHIDPLRFLGELRYMWDPRLYLGSHNGFTQIYLTPYGFLYGIFSALHIPSGLAQRLVIFLINLWIAAGMYWALKFIAPGVNVYGRLAAGSAYLFNMYVAFNTQGSVPMLLPYASLPWIAGALAASLEGMWPPLFAGAAIALFVFIGSGVNPPLIAIDAAIVALFVLTYAICRPIDRATLARFGVTATSASLLTLALNLYWIVPFLDYMRTVWMAGVLDESPLMHNADSSFSNVLRGLGQWAMFQMGVGRPYYPWAHAYEVGQFFAFALWLVPMCAIAVLLFRRRHTRATLFFLIAALVSAPLAVGYYQGPLGKAVTEPLYNYLYTYVPGFQMFRSAYKWVGAYEFGIAGLFGIFVWLVSSYSVSRRRIAGALIVLPLVAYIPILIDKANYPLMPFPAWMHREDAMAGRSPDTRVAIFPGQFLERFDWGEPNYYVEHALIQKPMFYGYLGAATNEAADQWLRLAYRRAREGDPSATDIFRTLSVSEILQRDDFRADQDFAFPDTGTTANATEAHDALTRVMGLRQVSQDGANRLYAVPDPLPLVYGVTNPRLRSAPAAGIATSSDPAQLAAGNVQLSADGMDVAQLRSALASGATASDNLAAIDNYTASMLLPHSAHVEIQHAGQVFSLPKSGLYRIVALNVGLDYTYPPAPVLLDRRMLRAQSRVTGEWQLLGTLQLQSGHHKIGAKGVGYLMPLLVAFVDSAQWNALRPQVAAAVAGRPDAGFTIPVKGMGASIVIPKDGMYRLQASGLPQFLPPYRNLALGHITPANAPKAAPPVPAAVELPYVPSDGITAAPLHPLPEEWYADARTYDWNRGSAVIWWLLRDGARFTVLSPASHPVNVSLHMQFSPRTTLDALSVRAGAAPAVRVPVSGDASYVQRLSVPLRLLPGANAVTVSCNCTGDPYIGAVLYGMSFTARGSDVKTSPLFPHTANLAVRAIPRGVDLTLPTVDSHTDGIALASISGIPRALSGDPFVNGYAKRVQGRPQGWMAAVVSTPERRYYRLFPLAPGSFNIALAQSLPNGASDKDANIEGAWFVLSHSGTLRVATLNETVTAIPGYAGKAVGTSGMRAPRTIHVTADPIVVPLGTFGEIPADAQYISLSVRNASALPRLEYNDGTGWRLAGDTAGLARPSTLLRRSDGSFVYRYDFGQGSGVPDALHDLYEASNPGALQECCTFGTLPQANQYRVDPSADGSDARVDAAAAGKAASFMFVSIPQDWVTTNGRSTVIQLPRYTFASIPASAKVRLVVDPAADAVRTGALVIVDPPRYIVSGGVQPLPALLVDGKPASPETYLRAGVHRISAADARTPIDLLHVTQNAAAPARRVDMRVSYRSPVSMDVTLPKGSPPFLLVLNETYYRAWSATSGGRALQHAQANGFANGWFVPASAAGTHITIEFTSQRRFQIAAAISLLALLAVAAIAIRTRPRWSAL